MNCPQCQTANGSGSAFCGNCGARMTVAQTAATAGYPPPPGETMPIGYGAPGAPTGHDGPQGYNAGGYNSWPQQPGYPQGQYQPPGGGPRPPRATSLPPVNFDHNRLTAGRQDRRGRHVHRDDLDLAAVVLDLLGEQHLPERREREHQRDDRARLALA